MTIPQQGDAPYAPPSGVIQVIEEYRNKGLSVPFTATILAKIGFKEEIGRRIIVALKALDLLDAEATPTDAFKGLKQAPSTEFEPRLAAVVKAAYAEVFKF